ncbi:hypothetical protein, partial [Aliarcobacter faecis]
MNFKDNQKSVEFTFKIDGKTVNISLNGIVPLLNLNKDGIINPTLVLINKNLNEQNIDSIVNNKVFSGSEIIDNLEALISNKPNSLALINDFSSLVETLESAASGGEGVERTSGVRVGLSDTFNDSLFGLQETDRWINLERAIFSLPIDSNQAIATTIIIDVETLYTIKLDGLKVIDVIEGDKAKYKLGLYDENGNPIAAPEDITVTFKYTYKTANQEDIIEVKSVTIAKGQTGVEFEVEIVDDVYNEERESFEISIDSISTQSTEEIKFIKENIETTIIDEVEAYVPKEPTDPSKPVDPSNPVEPQDPNTNTRDNVNVDIIGVKTAVIEGESFEYKVTLTDDRGYPVIAKKDITFEIIYKYDTADGNDIAEVKTVTVKAGQSEVIFKIDTVDDNIIEDTEYLDITLNKNDVIGSDQFEHLTIRDRDIKSSILDNDEYTVTVEPVDPTDPTVPNIPGNFGGNTLENGNVKIPEGNDALFKTKVENPSSKDEIVEVKLANGTADINDDLVLNNVKFYDKNGNELVSVNKGNGEFEVTLPKGETEFYTKVPTFDDLIVEGDENFTITATLDGKTGTGTGIIVDNDEYTVTVEPVDPTDPTVPNIPGNFGGNTLENGNVKI